MTRLGKYPMLYSCSNHDVKVQLVFFFGFVRIDPNSQGKGLPWEIGVCVNNTLQTVLISASHGSFASSARIV